MSDGPIQLDDRVDVLPGVGAKARTGLADAFGIETIRDLLEHYPRRYQDAGEVLDLSQVRTGEPATLIGEVLGWDKRRIPGRGRKRPLDLTEGRVRQASGRIFAVTFFNQPWRANQLAPGTVAAFSGKVKRFKGDLQLASPDVEVLGRVATGLDADAAAERLQHQRLLAVYPATEAWPSFKLANLVETALEQLPELPDWLPEPLLDELDLLTYDAAMRGIHLPPDHATRTAARRRLVFDELFSLQLGVQRRRAQLEAEVVGLDNAPVPDGRAQAFLDALPFPPTGAQQRAFVELAQDLGSRRPMHRLLQGDVGSGKTVVAVWALLNAVDHGRQAAFMVPTEVLAEQHFRTLTTLLAPLGVNVLDGIRVELLTSSTPVKARRRILSELLTGELDVLVGTHALLEEGVQFADLGVVVIDEQHRFGVAQRVKLKEKGGAGPSLDPDAPDVMPDVMVMTATPIPRSLALTFYGDLDVTVLDEMPPGREPITTQLITPEQRDRRDKLYEFIRREAAEGRRAYVVCPLVEEGELPAKNVTDEHRRLAEEVFPELTVELIHGRMRPDAKDAAMTRFRTGEAQILVATTVIEVGVDVPEATIMVIEDAERFGISQLHQLRGRVGRGGGTSYCVLFAGWSSELADASLARLEAVAATTDGFELADRDLQLRGSGLLFGRLQSGSRSDIKLADLSRDRALIEETRQRARTIVAADPDLEQPDHGPMRDEVTRRYEGRGVEIVAVDESDELGAFAALESG